MSVKPVGSAARGAHAAVILERCRLEIAPDEIPDASAHLKIFRDPVRKIEAGDKAMIKRVKVPAMPGTLGGLRKIKRFELRVILAQR